MKSRDEIMIIMLQWLRLYTLGSRGSRELKTFLETRFISSQVNQKSKNNEELHGFLRETWPKDRGQLKRSWWLIHGFVGAVPWGDVVASRLATN